MFGGKELLSQLVLDTLQPMIRKFSSFCPLATCSSTFARLQTGYTSRFFWLILSPANATYGRGMVLPFP